MLENKVTALTMARAVAAHAAARQGLIAQNVAHADTPGYRPRDLPSFAESLRDTGAGMRATRPGHLGAAGPATPRPVTLAGTMSPNGNAVSLEAEMLRAAEVRQAHDMALAIRATLSGAIRAALGRGRGA